VKCVVRLTVRSAEVDFHPNAQHRQAGQSLVEGIQHVEILAVDVDLQEIQTLYVILLQIFRNHDAAPGAGRRRGALGVDELRVLLGARPGPSVALAIRLASFLLREGVLVVDGCKCMQIGHARAAFAPRKMLNFRGIGVEPDRAGGAAPAAAIFRRCRQHSRYRQARIHWPPDISAT